MVMIMKVPYFDENKVLEILIDFSVPLLSRLFIKIERDF